MAWVKLGSTKLTSAGNSIVVDGGEDNTATLSDDFSSDNFTPVGSESAYGVSSNRLNWTTYRKTTSGEGEYIALPSTFSGDFVVRFKFVTTTAAYDGSNEEYLFIGLTNSASCLSTTNQNVAGMYFHNYSSSDSKIQVTYRTNTSPFSGTATSVDFNDSSTYYVEIAKGGDRVDLRLYSDETYETEVSGGTTYSTSGGATDQYTHFAMFGMYHSSAGSTSALGYIDDLKIYKDVSEVRKGFTKKKHLSVIANIISDEDNDGSSGSSSGVNVRVRFNGDDSTSYAYRFDGHGGGYSSESNSGSGKNYLYMFDQDEFDKHINASIVNVDGEEKAIISHTVHAASNGTPNAGFIEGMGKYTVTSGQIEKINVYNTGQGSYQAGSEVTVYGTDGTDEADDSVKLDDGLIFEESDTGKHYIWNATTSTWTEIA